MRAKKQNPTVAVLAKKVIIKGEVIIKHKKKG